MFEKILVSRTLALLKSLNSSSLPPSSCLGGETALALHLGHRRSADLDFFTPVQFVESRWEQKLGRELSFKPLKRDWQTLIGDVSGVKFSLFGYKYPLIGEKDKFYGIQVASLPDLAAMKLDTVLGRGTKRDLIDVYFLAQKFGLAKLFEYYGLKYGELEGKEIMLKKSLIFFEDADKVEMPDMLIQTDWEEIKKWFRKNVPKLQIPE